MTALAAALVERLAALRLAYTEAALWWLGQSTFLLRFENATVFVDPYLAPHADRLVPPAFAPEDARGLDVVAITHDHLDHLDAESLPGIAAASPSATFVAPAPAVERIVGLGVSSERVVGLQQGESAERAGVRIHAVAASHADDAADGYGFYGGAFLGFVFDGGVRIYHAGDTVPYDGLAESVSALRPHVALLPINGRDAGRESQGIAGNLDEREAAELAAAAGAELLVPMHYDMFASNPGSPAKLVEIVRRDHPSLAVLVATRDRPFVFRSAR
jgi:L-ascorbate metabolism protein UlaG (beta-lactamase superfamily)